MATIHRSRRAALGIAAFLAGALVTPLAVTAEEQALAVVPAAPSWDETSGYGAVEASRARASAMLAPSAISSQVSPDVRWAPARVMAADLASGRGGLSAADLAAARDWDETSGYGNVEASRADQ